jgi:hypothetical protein
MTKPYTSPLLVRLPRDDPRVARTLILLEEEKQRRAAIDVLEQLARFRP